MHTWVRPRAVGELRSLERFWPCCSAPARWGYPLPNGLNTYYFFNPPSAYRIPLADSWNLTVQHQFTPTLTAEAGYVGNVGRHLFINPNVNQAALDPNCAADGTCNDFNARRLFYQKFGLTQGYSGYIRDLQLRQLKL